MPKDTAAIYRRDIDRLAAMSEKWDRIHADVQERIEFLIDGMHYDDDDTNNKYSKNSREVRWVGQETFHLFRHELGQVTEPGVLTPRPVDRYGDSDLGEIAVRIINSETENPAKEWEDAWDDVLGSASAGGYGVGWLDFIPDEGPWGEIIFSMDDPRNFMCDLRVKSVHHPRCRYVVRKVRMTISEAKRRCREDGTGWNKAVVDRLKPDDGHDFNKLSKINESNKNARITLGNSSNVDEPGIDDDQEFTAYYIWYRRGESTESGEGYHDFDPKDRYLRCTSCGYRTESQGKLGQELPEELEGACPECLKSDDIKMHGDMERIDGMDKQYELLAFPDGELHILAPYALQGVEDFLYKGPWPFKLRSYPCTFISRFRHPFFIFGPSLTDLNWWNQIATDMLMRLPIERMLSSSPFMLMPLDGIEDARGNPFRGAPENGWTAFYDGETAPVIEMRGGDPGIPAAWHPIYSAARMALTGHTGIADFNMSEGQSRDIPAHSVELQIKQQEIPIAHYKRRYQRQRGLLIGVYYDMMRAVFPEERLYRLLGPDAQDAVRALSVSDLPNFDFFFDTTPDMQPQDEARSKALEVLINVMKTDPWAIDLVARVNKFSPSLVREAKQAFQKYQQDQIMMQQQQMQTQQMAKKPPASARRTPSSMVEELFNSMGQGVQR